MPGNWTLVQTGGASYPTGIMDTTACYVAVVSEPCFDWLCPSEVEVCPNDADIGQISIVSTDPSCHNYPVQINGVWNVCGDWKGVVQLAWTGAVCDHTFDWFVSPDNGAQ